MSITLGCLHKPFLKVFLPTAQFQFNTNKKEQWDMFQSSVLPLIHESTLYSPFELMFTHKAVYYTS